MTASPSPMRIGSAAKCASVVVCAITTVAANSDSSSCCNSPYGGTRDVRSRRRELNPVSRQRVGGALLETRIDLQPDVGTQSEVDQRLATEGHDAAVESLVLRGQVGKAARDRLRERFVDDRPVVDPPSSRSRSVFLIRLPPPAVQPDTAQLQTRTVFGTADLGGRTNRRNSGEKLSGRAGTGKVDDEPRTVAGPALDVDLPPCPSTIILTT